MEQIRNCDLFFIPKPFGSSTSWQAICKGEFNLYYRVVAFTRKGLHIFFQMQYKLTVGQISEDV